jgi:hypothetical protein
MTTNGAPRRIQSTASLSLTCGKASRACSRRSTSIRPWSRPLPEIALLKRQVKMFEDAHNKSIQNAVTHLGHRIATMESAQHVADQNAIADLEKRLDAAAQLAAALPAWMNRGSQF